ncbi:DoxX family protein [soil metagenome]
MFGLRGIARSLLAAIFIFGGARSLGRAERLVPVAEPVTDRVQDAVDIDVETSQLVRLNAGVQVVGGALFALGIVPRVTALALGATLIPTTLAAHRFWEAEGTERNEQTVHALKNAGLLGGLIFAALDTGGRPSVFWAGRRAARHGAEAIGSTSRSLAHAVTP